MKQCTGCGKFHPDHKFGSKKYTLADGTAVFYKRARCRDCTNSDNLKRYHNRKSTREAHKTASYRYRIRKYGLTVEEYEDMLRKQKGRCYICGNEPFETLHIDHCHTTGKIRKLLCSSCNTALGHTREDIKILEKLISYVKEHNMGGL